MGGIPRRFINFLILHINFCFLIHLVRTKTDYGGTMEISIFFKQMAQRTCAIFLVKIIGFLARIPLFRMLGPEGIGLYQMAYSDTHTIAGWISCRISSCNLQKCQARMAFIRAVILYLSHFKCDHVFCYFLFF